MLIRRLIENDLDAVWSLRLRALKDNPESFGSTYDEVVARGKESMLHRLRQEGDDMFYLGAFDDTLIGMAGFARESGVKDRHKGTLISMYVLPERRGQGVGKKLVQQLVIQVKQLSCLEQLHLAVVTTALSASKLYRSLGFELYGTAPQALKMGDQYWDEDLMLLRLH